MVWVPWRPRAATPQAKVACAGLEAETHQEAGVAPAPVVVEVRCCRADAYKLDIDIKAILDAEHVAEQAPVSVDSVRLRLAVQAHRSTGREKTLRDPRRLCAVALREL